MELLRSWVNDKISVQRAIREDLHCLTNMAGAMMDEAERHHSEAMAAIREQGQQHHQQLGYLMPPAFGGVCGCGDDFYGELEQSLVSRNKNPTGAAPELAGRICLTPSAVPTIFTCTEERVEELTEETRQLQVAYSSLHEVGATEEVSVTEEVSAMDVVDVTEESYASEGMVCSFAPDHSSAIMTCICDHAYTPYATAVTRNKCDTDRLAMEHSYCTVQAYNSPRTLKRKAYAVQGQLCAARKKLRLMGQKTRRLKAKVTSLKDTVSVLQRKLLISTDCASLLEGLEDVPREIFLRLQQGKKSMFSENMKQFATTLHFYSAKAYDYVREELHLALPHPQTIRKWYSSISADPGFTVASFTALKSHVDEQKKAGKYTICSLMMDEMYIHKQTEFGGDQIHGYVNIGSGEIENVVATQALVLMVVAINGSWKIPIAYFLINSMTGAERANVIRESLVRLHAIGVQVVSLTCDGPSQNFSMIRELGAELDIMDMRPYFYHPQEQTQKIHVLLDPCHMIKLLRNVYSTAGVLTRDDGQEIKWQYIEELHKLQEKEGLRLGNKLRLAHIEWRNQKMKVHLAAQLFSSSVADALEYCEQELKRPQFSGCGATVHFLRTVDAAFDVLNSRNPLGKGHKAPLKPSTIHRARGILEEMESLLRGLKVRQKDALVHLHRTKSKTTIFGFIACCKSVISIYEDLVEQPAAPCRYLLTYKLSQDHLELFFSAIRARGGYNNNPNVRQFRGVYKRLLVRHQVRTGTGNCLLRDTTTILDSTPVAVNVARRMDVAPVETLEPGDATFSHLPDVDALSEYKEAAISYIAGFIVKKMQDKITCMSCAQALTTADVVHGFLTLKNRGGLQNPSVGIIAICQATERRFQQLLNSNEGKPPPGRGTTTAITMQVLSDCSEKNLFPELHSHMFDMCVEANHVHVLVKMASLWYSKIRLNHIARRETEKLRNGKVVRRKLTKLIHFYGE
ncbi:hypothetical protein ACEWY4_020563 [Coilia grayii]|uniref:DNA transposase THAP9 n=1 Tax=Coilia grayii TaxID=363190 RepID=A0ABD1JEP0_9TELE